ARCARAGRRCGVDAAHAGRSGLPGGERNTPDRLDGLVGADHSHRGMRAHQCELGWREPRREAFYRLVAEVAGETVRMLERCHDPMRVGIWTEKNDVTLARGRGRIDSHDLRRK